MSDWSNSNSFESFSKTSWSIPYNTKRTQSFKSYYDYNESFEDDSCEYYFSEELISEDSWDCDRDTYEDSEGFRRDIETDRKVTIHERSDKSKTYCLHPHNNIPGETKRNNETTKIWKDNK